MPTQTAVNRRETRKSFWRQTGAGFGRRTARGIEFTTATMSKLVRDGSAAGTVLTGTLAHSPVGQPTKTVQEFRRIGHQHPPEAAGPCQRETAAQSTRDRRGGEEGFLPMAGRIQRGHQREVGPGAGVSAPITGARSERVSRATRAGSRAKGGGATGERVRGNKFTARTVISSLALLSATQIRLPGLTVLTSTWKCDRARGLESLARLRNPIAESHPGAGPRISFRANSNRGRTIRQTKSLR